MLTVSLFWNFDKDEKSLAEDKEIKVSFINKEGRERNSTQPQPNESMKYLGDVSQVSGDHLHQM